MNFLIKTTYSNERVTFMFVHWTEIVEAPVGLDKFDPRLHFVAPFEGEDDAHPRGLSGSAMCFHKDVGARQMWQANLEIADKYFADNLELALGRDSREAIFRLELGLKSVSGAKELLNRRVKTSLEDPGQFNGIRVLMMPSDDGNNMVPVPVPQVGLRHEGEDWRFLIEKELTPENIQQFKDSSAEIRIYGVGQDCDRLRQRLSALGIDFIEGGRTLNQPITEQSSLTVVYDINNDETIVRAACKIGFNYAAKVLGCTIVRRAGFDAARRFVRYGEAPVRLATVQQLSVLVGLGADSSRIHACSLGWDSGYLVAVVSLFNEVTYGLRLCAAEPNEFVAARHFFDPLTRKISEAGISN